MFDLDTSPLFTPKSDPKTGLTVYILTEKVAPVQQSFYFVNDGMTTDGRYLWLYCAFPPSGSGAYGRTLAVVDFKKQTLTHFPETQFQHASPFVDPDTGSIYWTTGPSVWRRGPAQADGPELVNSLPEEVVRHRSVTRVATHLSRSADGKEFFVDVAMGGAQYVFGTLPLDGGDFQFWHHFDRNHNHAQFSPVDPDMVLFAEEYHSDPITGLRFVVTNRLWTIRRGESPKPIYSEPTVCSHEWWDADGQHAWSVRGKETWRTNIETAEREAVECPVNCWHSHTTRENRLLVCDSTKGFYRGCPSTVNVLNRDTGQSLQVADNPGMTGITGTNYHIDPHPRFCCNDQLVTFTTTVRGEVDLAIVRTQDLVSRTSP